MNFTNNAELLNELNQIANSAIVLRDKLADAEKRVQDAFNPNTQKPVTTNEALMAALDIDPTKICCASGPMTYNFSPEQYN